MARSPYPHSDRDLLARIGRSSQSKAGYKQLIRELGLGGGRERRLLLEQLTRMVARGDLQKLEDELWTIPRRNAEPAPQPIGAADRAAGRHGGANKPGRWEGFETASRGGRDRLLSGRLELHRDGFGFVRLEVGKPGSGPTAKSSVGPQPTGDVFIPPNALHGAMHGDLVLVDEDPPRDGRRSGRIARVLTRRNPTMVGIFHTGRSGGGRRHTHVGSRAESFVEMRGNYVQPLDERLGGPIEIPEGAENIAQHAGSPHRTLGQEAAVPDSNDTPTALDGLAVEVEITSYAQPGRPARGRLVEVLGPPDAFGVDVEIVIRKHAIPHTFPTHVLAEADERAGETVATLAEDEMALREDFRDLPIVTIDGETARDFDDAVLVRSLPNGHSELQVHIADVGWYVRSGSALDVEARVRGTSVYFPDRAVPMLPHALSSGMCSLLPHEDRLVLSCVMEIDDRGEVVGYRVGEGIIRSARRMTYTSVQRCLNASPVAAVWNGAQATSPDPTVEASKESHTEHAPSASRRRSVRVTPAPSTEDLLERERIALEQPQLPEAFDRMLELALRLNRKRARRGSIDFDLPEPVVEFDPEGNMQAIVRSERGWAHRLIEEFMLSANECVATWLTGQGIPSMYRIHEMPDPKRIMEFEETAAGFGQTLGIGALPVKRLTMKSDRREAQRRGAQGRNGRPAQAHDIPERIAVTPQMYQRLVSRIQGTPEERILAYLMLRSLKQARYSEKNEGHFALASPCYTHFTSPIRRYPDLIVHRLLRTMLRRGADPRGGAIRSGDPQPWATELARSQGRHAGSPALRAERPIPSSLAPLRRPEPANLVEGTEQPGKRFTRTKRPGRIGWNEETLPNGEETVTGLRSRVQQGERAVSAEDHFAAAMLRAEASERETAEQERAEQERAERQLTDENATASPRSKEHSRLRGDHDDELSQADPGRSGEPISREELSDIAVESSQAERRSADAERELIEWKKMKFMSGRIGEDFRGIILSITKYGFFVELDELFIEGLVPLSSLTSDFYSFRDADRTICGVRSGHCFRVGDRVDVILDRIDRQQRRLQFALTPGTEPATAQQAGSLRTGKTEAKKARAEARRLEKLASNDAAPATKAPKVKAKAKVKAKKKLKKTGKRKASE